MQLAFANQFFVKPSPLPLLFQKVSLTQDLARRAWLGVLGSQQALTDEHRRAQWEGRGRAATPPTSHLRGGAQNLLHTLTQQGGGGCDEASPPPPLKGNPAHTYADEHLLQSFANHSVLNFPFSPLSISLSPSPSIGQSTRSFSG